MKNIFQTSVLILVLAARIIHGQAEGGLFLFAANVSDESTIHINRGTKNENNSNKFYVERKTITSNWKTISSDRIYNLSNSPNKYSFKVPSTIINYTLPFDLLLYGQNSHDIASLVPAKDIQIDTILFNNNLMYKDLNDNSRPFNLKDLNQGKNIAIDLFTKYGDNILAIVAGYFQGKCEGYRVTEEQGGPLMKVYTKSELNSRWHSYAVYKTSLQIGTVFTIFLSGSNNFWRGVIQSATCLSLNNLISDGVYNNAKGFNWFRQSDDTGWGLEKALTPGVKLGILSALVAIRIIYELWIKSE